MVGGFLMKKIVFSSFEKTLIDEEEAIDIKTIIEIDKFRKKGNLFAIISEDVLDYSLEYNRDFPFIDYIIALDGAVIYDVNNEKIIYKKSISVGIIKKIMALSNSIEFYSIDSKYDKNSFIDMYDSLKSDIYKLKVRFSGDKERELLITKLSKLSVNMFVNENDKCIDIISKNVSRVNSIKKIVGKKYTDIYVIVGIEKDKEVNETYDSYVVEDAPSILKNSSKNQLNRKNTFGVLEFLQEINT